MRAPGTIPPSVAARISSSDASHDFIFSSRLADDVVDVDGGDDAVTALPLVSSDELLSSPPMKRRNEFLCETMNLLLLTSRLLLLLLLLIL